MTENDETTPMGAPIVKFPPGGAWSRRSQTVYWDESVPARPSLEALIRCVSTSIRRNGEAVIPHGEATSADAVFTLG